MRKLRVALLVTSITILGSALWPAGAAHQKGKPKGPVPFGVDKRPAPSGTDLAVLVPTSVGAFRRDALPAGSGPRADEDLNVTYRSGAESVFFGFSIPESAADAHEAVKVTRDEAVASKVSLKGEQYSVGTDPSYFRAGSFMSWSRGRYFFYAKASSPRALEDFMRAFPY
jgi:hypothetical protein